MLGCDVAPKLKADNRVVAEGEDGYFNGTTGLPVGLHNYLKPGCAHVSGWGTLIAYLSNRRTNWSGSGKRFEKK